jgi:hypothetical protein
MTKDQIIEAIWLKARKLDTSVRKAVIEELVTSAYDEMVSNLINAAPEIGYQFTKTYDFEILKGQTEMELPAKVINTLHFKGGVFKVTEDTGREFIPVRGIEMKSVSNPAVNEIVQSGGVLFSVADNKISI